MRHGDEGEKERCTGGTQGFEVVCWSATAVGSGRQDGERQGAEEAQARWLEQEQQEWARLSATRDRHLADGEQPSHACSATKNSAEERLTVAWHTLPTPLLFELADVPYPLLAQASGADVSALVEKNLKNKRAAQLRRVHERRQGDSEAVGPSRESEEDLVKLLNALLDWCRSELFPFLAEVDSRMVHTDAVARASFLYRALIHPLREISRQSRAGV